MTVPSWLFDAVAELDTKVRAIVLFGHKPPYTNARGVGMHGDKRTRGLVETALSASNKIVAVISGHAHGYEHFACGSGAGNDVHFVVSGGGGGPRRKLATAKEGADLFRGGDCSSSNDKHPEPRRPFNYLLLSLEDSEVNVRVRGVCPHDTVVRPVDHFRIPLPRLKSKLGASRTRPKLPDFCE